MTNIFDVVQAMSGHKNVIVIPVPYLEFFKGDQQAHALAAVLNQLVFWSGISSSASEGWFYKSHEELADEIKGISGEEQARRLVDKLRKKYFPGIIETKTKKVNGTPVTHYKLDGNALIAMIFPAISETSKVRNGNVESDESNRRKCGMETAEMQNHGNVEDADSYLYTDLNSDHNLQINKTLSSQNSNESSDQQKIDFLNRYPEAVIYSSNLKKWGTQEDLTCAEYLFERKKWLFKERGLGEPDDITLVDWVNDIRLMREIDKREHKDICRLYKRITLDNFWHKAILCPRKLREQWEKISIEFASAQKVSIDPVERDAAYTRIIGSRSQPKNRIEEIAATLAGKQGIRGMTDFVGRKAWIGVWQQAADQAAKEEVTA